MTKALSYLQVLSSESRERVSKKFEAEIEEICFLISKQVSLLDTYKVQKETLKESFTNDQPLDVAFGVMYKAAMSNMASLELAIGGYMWEPVTLLRTALENCASAWDIVHNPKQFERWRNDNFSSAKSISRLTKEIEPIGCMYGLLSKMYVHVGPLNVAPAMYLINDEPEIQNFGYLPQGKEFVRATEIYFVLLIVFICLQLTEIVFWKYEKDHETIELLPNGESVKVRVSERHRKFVDASMEHFKKVVSKQGRVL